VPDHLLYSRILIEGLHLKAKERSIPVYMKRTREGEMHPTRYNPRLMRTGVRSEQPVARVLEEEFPFPGLPVGSAGEIMWSPPVDFVEDKTHYTILMDSPGMTKADVSVNYKDGILYVHGKRMHEKEVGDDDATAYLLERRCGSFMRHFHLHATVMPDKIRANYKEGILKISVPKNKKASSKHVSVKIN
jgi:HSP20 family protein